MSEFRFKNFTVQQQRSPLKVNTDSILLGAAVQIDATKRKVLDVGTGNGVIALLLASRFQHIELTAIDPDEGAYLDALENFSNSNFAARLRAIHTTMEALDTVQKYDVLVSNPPYFIDAQKSDKQNLNRAKHLDKGAFVLLINSMVQVLSDTGQIWLILPLEIAQATIQQMKNLGLSCNVLLRFHAHPNKLNKRWVLCFEHKQHTLQTNEFYIRNVDGSYHQDYKDLAAIYHHNAL